MPASQYARLYIKGGSIDLYGDLTVNAGTRGGNTALKLLGASDQNYTYTGGVMQDSITIDKSSGSVMPGLGEMNFPAKAFTLHNGDLVAPNGLFSTTAAYTQTGGTFTPSAGDVSVCTFALSGGSFTAPTGTMTVACTYTTANNDIFTLSGGDFYHNDGTLKFRSWFAAGYLNPTHNIFLGDSSLAVNNLIFSGGNMAVSTWKVCYTLGELDTLIAHGDLTLESDIAASSDAIVNLNGGTIELYGNLSVSDRFLEGSTALKLIGERDQTYTYTGGTILNSITIDKSSGSVTPGLDPMNFPAKAFTLHKGDFIAPNGFFSATADYIQTGGTFTPSQGDVSVCTFALSGGSFTAPTGTMSVACTYLGTATRDIFTLSGGDFYHNDGTLQFRTWHSVIGYPVQNIILSGEPLQVHNLIFTGGNYLTAGRHMIYLIGSDSKFVANGDVILEGGISGSSIGKVYVNGGKIECRGDLTVNPYLYGGSVALSFTGTNEQSLTHTGGNPPATNFWTLAKTGGRLSLATDFTLSGKTQDIHWLSGELNLNTNVLIVGRNVVVTEAGPSALGVSVAADAAGCLIVSNSFTGIDKLDLNVEVRATASELKDKTYQILTNKTLLGSEFKTVNWASPWSGKVNYSENDGKEVWLYNFEKKGGTIFVLR